MDKSNVVRLTGRDTIIDPLTGLLRAGARQLLQEVIEAEVQELACCPCRIPDGR